MQDLICGANDTQGMNKSISSEVSNHIPERRLEGEGQEAKGFVKGPKIFRELCLTKRSRQGGPFMSFHHGLIALD